MTCFVPARLVSLRWFVLAALCAAVLFPPRLCRAGGGPENVAVVVNADSWASLAVANEFVRLRGVPAGNVVYLSDVPGPDPVDVDVFRERILLPVLKTLEGRKIAGQIDCVVWSADLPYAVNVNKDVGATKLPQVITPTASINGLTYLYPFVLAKNISYLGLGANFYARRPLALQGDATAWSDEDRKLGERAGQLLQQKKNAEAASAMKDLLERHPKSPLILYNLACCLGRLEKPDEAMTTLRRAFEAGWFDANAAREDDDLKPLHGRAEFKQLLDDMAKTVVETQPPHGFRAAYAWSPAGEIVPPNQGVRYLLSTMLAVTSGRGNSVTEALEYLRRSAAADSTFPGGTVYYLTNGDVRSRTRRWAFASAVEGLKKLGVKAEIVEGALPQKKADVMGAMVGIADFNWEASGSATLPGAICEHLTSTGAVMAQDGGQTPISAFLRQGCAGSSGTVTEPYAIQAKFPTPFLHVYYARGCSLAEAFYQSVAGPYQLLIVGDPLCMPWARRPAVALKGLSEGAEAKGTISIRPVAAEGNEAPVGHFEVFVDGARTLQTVADEARLDTEALADGSHDLRVVGVAADPVETQGRFTLRFRVNNHGRSVSLSAEKTAVALDEAIRFDARAKGAASVALRCNGREVGRAEGEGGEMTVEAGQIGLGDLTFQAVATFAPAAGAGGGKTEATAQAFSDPVEVRVAAPPPLPPVASDAPPTFAKGLAVVPEGGAAAAAESTRPGDWLAKAGVKPKQPFAVEGVFDAPKDDIYQFQLRTPLAVSLDVDGKTLASGESKEWRYLPVALKAGPHRLRLSSKGGADLRLDVRFGGPGSRSLDAATFRHLAGK